MDIYEYIENHLNDDPAKLILKEKGKIDSDLLQLAVTQIIIRNKFKSKFGEFLDNIKFIVPDISVAEQATDWRVATFHAALVCGSSSLLDMTAGLGIDAFSMAMYVKHVDVCELDYNRYEILQHNAEVLASKNISIFHSDSIAFLENNPSKIYDVIFIDPARRDTSSNRFYSFEDSRPNILVNMPIIKRATNRLFIKASPMLDLTAILRQLECIYKIYVISVKNDCKEILIEIRDKKQFEGFVAIDLNDEGIISEFEVPSDLFEISSEDIVDHKFLENAHWLYEPNSAVMKLPGAASALINNFPWLKKMSPNTNLYLSATPINSFPGRQQRIERIISKKDYKSLCGERLNIVSRNYPLSAQELRKKLKVKEGNDQFLYGCRIGKLEAPIIIQTHIIRDNNMSLT